MKTNSNVKIKLVGLPGVESPEVGDSRVEYTNMHVMLACHLHENYISLPRQDCTCRAVQQNILNRSTREGLVVYEIEVFNLFYIYSTYPLLPIRQIECRGTTTEKIVKMTPP